MWRNTKPKANSGSTSPIVHEDIVYDTPKGLCKLWETYYKELLNEQPNETAQYDNIHHSAIRSHVEYLTGSFNTDDDATGTLAEEFTINEIASICKNLPNNKSPGYDRITNECLKYGGYALYAILCNIYNAIIEYGYIPPGLKHSIVIPLYKGKNKPKTALNSYRGVSLTPTLNKVLEKLVLCRLKPWLDKQDFPPPLQQAGRKGTNCVSPAYAVQEAIHYVTSQNTKVYGCFLDIQSAYDVINWHGLLYKMALIGIKDKLWHLFRVWLFGSTAQILVHGQSSDIFDISRSIKQGGLLSTLYFVAFYYDIHRNVKEGPTQSLTFHDIDIASPTMADDTLLVSTSVKGLQLMIDNAFNYATRWRFTYSPNKSKCITFGESRARHTINKEKRRWYLGAVALEEVDHYTYLGIVMSSDGSSTRRTQVMARRGYSSFGILKSSGFHSDGLSPITCSII